MMHRRKVGKQLMDSKHEMPAEMITQEDGRRQNERCHGIRRRILLTLSLAACLMIGSTLISMLSPPPSIDEPSDQATEYASIEQARQGGYTGYAPTYLPDGYAIDRITITTGTASKRATFRLQSGELHALLIYAQGKNLEMRAPPEESATLAPFVWNGFSGTAVQYDEGAAYLTCVSRDAEELISLGGDMSMDNIMQIITHMERP